MHDPWDILTRAGVPLGVARAREYERPAATEIRAALDMLATRTLSEVEREALAAWLAAFAHHWPTRFASVLQDRGPRWQQHLATSGHDANRFIKMRRIAIAHLAHGTARDS